MDEQVIGEALLVPDLRLAVMQTDEGMLALRGPESNALTPFHDGELGLIRDAGHLLLPVPKSDLQLDRIRQTLRIESERQTALRFVIQGLDRTLSDGLRRKSIELAEEQLGRQAVLEFVQNRLWGSSIPDDADVDGAIRIGGGGACRATGVIYVEMARLRPYLYRLENAWRQVSVQQSPDFPARHVRADLIDAGAFRRCAFALADGDGSTISSLVMDQALASIIRARVPQPQHLLVSLSKALSEKAIGGKQPATTPEALTDAVIDAEEEDPIRTAILAAIEEDRTDHIRLADRVELILEKIEKQKNSILKETQRGNISRARRYLLDLVRYQISNGGLLYLCKSLSDLAARILKFGEFIFADQLYGYANLANDVDVVPLTGRAEILKAQGKLDQALAAYDDAASRFPQDAFPVTGRAEVLKAQGKLNQALATYDDAASRFPQNVVPLTGRAEVLKAQGKLDQALAAYDDAASRFPQEVVPLNGRADVLKAQGKLDMALAAYDEAASRFPQDVFPFTGRAEVLKAQGKLDMALAAYNDAVRLFPQEVVPRTGRAEVLKAQGKLDQALAAYDEAASRFPQSDICRNGRITTLMKLGRETEIIKQLHDIQPVSIGDWVACHILGMAHLRLGQRDIARDIFTNAISRCSFANSIVYFQSTLAFMDSNDNNWQLSVERLVPLMDVPGAKPTATIILFSQVLAMTGQKPRAGQQLSKLNAGAGAEIIEIRDAIARRHGLLGCPQANVQEFPALDTAIREGIFETFLMAA